MKVSYEHNNYSINIDLSRDKDLSEAGKAIMEDRYLLKEYDTNKREWVNVETSPQQCFARAACEFASNQEHAQRLYDYASKRWMMFATPILTNAGNKQGLPISCFLSTVEDSIKGILEHHYENGYLASLGGGIGSNWGDLRARGTRTTRGNVSTGVIAFMRMMDVQMTAFNQGSTRRGSYAAYLDISHPEIEEFLVLRKPALESSDDINRRCFGSGFHHAVNIPDSFMEAVAKGDSWDLIDPHTKEILKTVDARSLWFKILTTRLETGEPYLHFIDTSNRDLPSFLKEQGLRINNTNLCVEIYLPTSKDRTAVCCLSSVNLEFFDEWKDNKYFISDIVEMLDNVLEFFINNAPKEMKRAIKSAKNSRDIGLGAMGFHLYLQKLNIPFESVMATVANKRVFSHIKNKALDASKELAKERGEAPDAVGTGKRFSHLLAIAPNANISVLCGNTSPSIEPYNANAFIQKTLSGNFTIKNKQLEKVLKEDYGIEDQNKLAQIWSSIISHGGSVQHLDFLSVLHKDVFKTAMELNPLWIIEHASIRQPFLCQGQSVNIFLPPDVEKNLLHKVHYEAWKKGLKGLYYCRSTPIRKTSSISIDTSKECLSCEG